MSRRGDDDGTRWAARPALARVLRVAVFAAPVVAAVGVSSLAHLALGAARGRAEQAWHLAVLLAVSTVALVVVDRVVRRALPLATLLELSMLFPDRAPTRLAVAREAVRKRPVEEQLARVREAGADPAAAAREILGLVAAMRGHDRPTRGHAERVRMLTDLVAEAMNVPARDRDLLRWAAILHDIGKLRVSPALLNKPGKPTEDEWALLSAHPMHGAQIAGALLPWLGEWGDVIVQHHERYDGTGYPVGLAAREISLGARIVAVADAYEVMTAARSYRRPISRMAAHRELVTWSGQQFDPVVVRAMVGLSAPRLRRAQGLIAWLSDIPLVATGYVPAATMARVVGVGTLAGGVATGVVLPAGLPAAHAPAPADQSPVTVSSPHRAQPPERGARTMSRAATENIGETVAADHPVKPESSAPTAPASAGQAAPAGETPVATGQPTGAAPKPAKTKPPRPAKTKPPKPTATGGPGKGTSVAGSSGRNPATGTAAAAAGTVTGVVTGVVGDVVTAIGGLLGSHGHGHKHKDPQHS